MKRFATGYRQKPDDRDKAFPLSRIMGSSESRPVSKHWLAGPVLNQGRTNSCVGHACYQLQVSEPLVRSNPPLSPFDIYGEARKIDEWTDNDDVDQGTSIRAGLNVLKQHGVISSYYWANDPDEVLDYLLRFGPLVFGTRWTDSMFEADDNGFVWPVGNGGGGHAYFAYAANWDQKYITCRNSWGNYFGRDGDFLLSFDMVRELLSEDGASAAAVVEL